MSKSRREQNYPDEIVMMADLLRDLNMVGGKSKIDVLDILGRMKDNQPRMFNELQADISQEQIRKQRYEAESRERDKKTMADKSGNPSSRDRSKNKKAMKKKIFKKDRPMNLSGQSRGGMAKTGSMDYRKKGMFYWDG